MKLRWPGAPVGRRSASSGRASVTTKIGELRDHSSRYSMKSSRDASAHCMSSKTMTDGSTSASRSKKSRHAANRSSRSWRPVLEAEQVREPRLDEAALAPRVAARTPRRRRASFAEGAGGVLVLGDARTHPDHLGERPVRHALAVGKAAAAVPVRDLREAVEVLVELPGQPRLADAGDAGDGDELGLALVGAGVEEVLDQAQLAVAADERGLEPCGLQRAARAGDDAQGPLERNEPDLALQLVLPASS